MEPLISMVQVSKAFGGRTGTPVRAVAEFSLEISAHETVGLIGESGSGKSTVGRLALGLLAPDAGSVKVLGESWSELGKKESRARRGEITVVFQEPFESLNPRMTVMDNVQEPLIVQSMHSDRRTRLEHREIALAALESVRLEASLVDRYPAHLSGGQQKRVGIARAIVTNPKCIVLDEPTASLDVSVQGAILHLLQGLQASLKLSYLFISHDIDVVEIMSDRIAVMYAGRIVELGPVDEVMRAPQHPYTKALISASRLGRDFDRSWKLVKRDPAADSLSSRESGCVLVGRCPIEIGSCSQQEIALAECGMNHYARCIRLDTK